MNNDMLHPTPDRLEAYAEGTLDGAERAVVDSHLVRCDRCRSELEELETLFEALAALPQFEPSAGFAERVMAGVQLRQPWPARIAARLRRLLPSSATGWTLAAVLLALPILTTGTLTAWLVSRPWFSAQTMAIFIVDRLASALLVVRAHMIGLALDSRFGAWILEGGAAFLAEVSARDVGAAVTTGAVIILGSCWVLYRYLFRTPMQKDHHVTHSV